MFPDQDVPPLVPELKLTMSLRATVSGCVDRTCADSLFNDCLGSDGCGVGVGVRGPHVTCGGSLGGGNDGLGLEDVDVSVEEFVSSAEESAIGLSVGLRDGLFVGFSVGFSVGILVDVSVGLLVGASDGILLGFLVGLSVGLLVGL